MTGQIFPLFQSGNILRQEMLEAISDYSYRFGELLYAGYADGIVSGCQLTTTQDAIILNPGILCFHGKLFLVKEPEATPYHPTNRVSVLKACYSGEVRTQSCIAYEMELGLFEDPAEKEGQIELCRFKLQPGAYLRCDYVDFEDRGTEYDTLNTIHSPYAAEGRSTLNPEITRAFATEMLCYPLENTIDVHFCLELLAHSEPVSAQAIGAYVKLREGKNVNTNKDLYAGLLKILSGVKSGNHQMEKTVNRRPRTIFVD